MGLGGDWNISLREHSLIELPGAHEAEAGLLGRQLLEPHQIPPSGPTLQAADFLGEETGGSYLAALDIPRPSASST